MGATTVPPVGMSSSAAYPADVTFAQGSLERSRLTTFFRFLIAIPNIIVLSLWGIAFEVTTILAWFAILFTGKYPAGLYSFGVSYMRMMTDTLAYLHFVTDEYPPWTGNDAKATSYPVQYSVVYSGASNRLTVFFRIILVIPAYIFGYVVYIAAAVVGLLCWFAIMFTGKIPAGMLSFLQGAVRTYMRILTYYFLMSDVYPPFSLS
jgi:hypothetical protein